MDGGLFQKPGDTQEAGCHGQCENPADFDEATQGRDGQKLKTKATFLTALFYWF